MTTSNKTHDLIRQNEDIVKKSQKHDANLQKNSILYFQVGLIVCLLAAFGLLEMKFETIIPKDYGFKLPEETFFINVPQIKPEVPVVDEPMKQKSVNELDTFIEVPDYTPDNLFKDDSPEPTVTKTPVDPRNVTPTPKIVEPEDVPFIGVEQVPIYPGCEKEKTNDAKRKCMSEKITKLVQRKFNGNIASDYGLSGVQKIHVEFKIDKTGHVTNIKTSAPHPKLAEEATRVINIIPEMIPGKQRDKNVGVIYNLPIIFQAQ